MKITHDVREYAAKQGIEAIPVAIEKGLEEKAREFKEKGAEIYQKV